MGYMMPLGQVPQDPGWAGYMSQALAPAAESYKEAKMTHLDYALRGKLMQEQMDKQRELMKERIDKEKQMQIDLAKEEEKIRLLDPLTRIQIQKGINDLTYDMTPEQLTAFKKDLIKSEEARKLWLQSKKSGDASTANTGSFVDWVKAIGTPKTGTGLRDLRRESPGAANLVEDLIQNPNQPYNRDKAERIASIQNGKWEYILPEHWRKALREELKTEKVSEVKETTKTRAEVTGKIGVTADSVSNTNELLAGMKAVPRSALDEAKKFLGAESPQYQRMEKLQRLNIGRIWSQLTGETNATEIRKRAKDWYDDFVDTVWVDRETIPTFTEFLEQVATGELTIQKRFLRSPTLGQDLGAVAGDEFAVSP